MYPERSQSAPKQKNQTFAPKSVLCRRVFITTGLLLCFFATNGAEAQATMRVADKPTAKSANSQKQLKARRAVPVQEQEPVTPITAPPTLAQQPAVPPTVNYTNGLLSIDAPNSNLSDIFNAVRRATGAMIDGGVSSDRVVVHLGPGHPNDVLSALLNGSRFDYVILGSPQQPGAVTRIVLTQRTAASSSPVAAASPAPRGTPRPANQADENGDSEDEQYPNRDAQGEEGGQQSPREPQSQPANDYAPTAQPPTNEQQQPKTPEQLYQQMQQMEQNRQQQNPQ